MKHIKTLISYITEAAITGKDPDTMGLPYANTLASNVNIKEEPSGSNKSTEIDRYFDLVGLDNRAQYNKTQYNKKTGKSFHRGYPWCAAFVYSMFDDFCKSIGVANPVVKTALVASLWSKADSSLKIPISEARKDPNLIKPGQIFIMLYGGGKGHTGIVTAVDVANKSFTTIEGNSTQEGSREGHRVCRNTRKLSEAKLAGFIDYFKGNRSEKFEKTIAKVVASAETDFSSTESSGNSSGGDITKQSITIAQTKFKELGYDLGTYGPNKDGVDGSLGTNTNTAILDYQLKNKLKQTGILDKETMAAITGKAIDGNGDGAGASAVAANSLEANNIVETANCTISIPLNVEGPVPTFIFYPGIPVSSKIGKVYMPPMIKKAVPDWYSKYIIIIPNTHTTAYNNVLSEAGETIKQLNPSINMGSINIGIFSGSGNNGADIAKKIVSIRPLNLILMDPTPGASLTKGISSATNVYMMYNPANWGSASYYTSGIKQLEDAVATSGTLDKVNISHMKIPSDMLSKYKGTIQSSLTQPKIKKEPNIDTKLASNASNKPGTDLPNKPYMQSFTDFN